MRSRIHLSLLCSGLLVALASLTHAQEVSFIRHDISTNLNAAYGVFVADINEDGLPDILTASSEGAKWWSNQGGGVFQNHNVGNLTGAWWVYAADVNKDGDLDVVASSPNPNADQIRLWLSKSPGAFDPPIVFPLIEAEAVHAGQLDSDEPLEIIGLSWGEDLELPGNDLVYFKDFLDGDTTHTKIFIDSELSGAHTASTHDFNGDKKVDVIAAGDRKIVAYRNNGNGSWTLTRTLSSTEGALSLTIIDINLDGKMDVICQTRTTQKILWFENTGGFDFTKHTVGDSIGECWSVQAGDLDADGDMDIFAASQSLDVIRAYINDGSFNFTPVVVAENFGGARAVGPMDVDQDGDVDIIGVASDDGDLAWFESVPLPQTLTVTSPNGGESWGEGSVQNITWTFTGSISAVKLEFSSDGGSAWESIDDNEPNDGSFAWTIPAAASTTCKVRVTSVINQNVTDESDAVFTIVTPSLTLSSPNGGELALIGANYNITWTDNTGLATVKIELSTNGGSTWTTVAANAPNNGSYSWAVPNSPSQTCLIRISDPADGTPNDVSNGNFTITNPTLALTAPNGGETWYIGTIQNITWNTVGTISTVKLEFSANNGTTWQTIVASVNNAGSYAWTIPANASTTCRVRVSDASDATRTDASNAVFTIATQFLSVTSPNGGQTLILGNLQNLTWISGGPIDNVKIELSRNGGGSWEVLTNSAANSGIYPWQVSGAVSNNCLLRVSDAADGSPVDLSDGTFAIANLAIILTAPNGGELWSYNTTYAIEWSTNGQVSGIRIEFSTNNGTSWTLITPTAPNTGSYNWAVPNNLSDNCLVRVSDSGDGSPFDVSDAVFRIVPPNQVPVANIGGPYSAPRNTSITFNASQSSDPDGDQLSFQWEFSDGQFMNGVQVSRSFNFVNQYSVTLKVSDGRGGESFASIPINIFNRAPVANVGGPYNTKPGNSTNFDASASSDPDGDALTYTWNFGDNTQPAVGGAQISHLYANLGSYQVIVKVQDTIGSFSYDTTTAVISNNLLPVVEIRASEVSIIGSCTDTYQIDFTIDLAQDPDGSVADYDWDFDDGSPHSNSSTSVSHTFAVPGIYDVKLWVTDNEEAKGVDSIRISLTGDQPPVASFTMPDDTVDVNTLVSFDASGSSDIDGGIVSFVWNFGDGTIFPSSQPTATHTYQTTGTANVLLTVSDGCGKTGIASKFLRVEQSVGVDDDRNDLPQGFELAQNYPNPISLRGAQSPVTHITFNLPKASNVQVTVYNIFGQEVRKLVRGMHGSGKHSAVWDLRDGKGELVSTGVYFYRLLAGDFLATKKLVITK